MTMSNQTSFAKEINSHLTEKWQKNPGEQEDKFEIIAKITAKLGDGTQISGLTGFLDVLKHRRVGSSNQQGKVG